MHFFFNDTATTEIYTLSLHDALPISAPFLARTATRARRSPDPGPRRDPVLSKEGLRQRSKIRRQPLLPRPPPRDRKSTRLNSSHANISYAVFCLKKKTRYNKARDKHR